MVSSFYVSTLLSGFGFVALSPMEIPLDDITLKEGEFFLLACLLLFVENTFSCVYFLLCDSCKVILISTTTKPPSVGEFGGGPCRSSASLESGIDRLFR